MLVNCARSFERRHAANRKAQDEIDSLIHKNKIHTAICAAQKSDQRVEAKRRERLRSKRALEYQQGAIIESRNLQEKTQSHLDAQQTSLCNELQKRRSQQASEQARVRRFVDESEELRELQLKLNAAQISKEREEQSLANKELKRRQQETEQIQEQEMDAQRKEADFHDEVSRVNKQQEFKKELDKQIKYKSIERERAYEIFLREKQSIDAIAAEVRASNEKCRNERGEARIAFRKMMQAYDVERLAFKKNLREEEASESRRIQEWAILQEDRLSQLEQKRTEQADLEAKKYKRVVAGMDNVRREREATEELLIELFIAEADHKIEEVAHAKKERQEKLKNEMMEANKLQKVMVAQRRRAEDEEEKRISQEMLAKFAEDERLEQMNAARRQRKKFEHRDAVQRLMAERRELYNQERAIEMEERTHELHQESDRLAIVEAERDRMLREYARRLRNYLPRGVVRNAKDHALVFGDIKDENLADRDNSSCPKKEKHTI